MDNPIYLIDRANWNGGTTSILDPQTCCSVFNLDKTMAMLIEEYRMEDPDIITIDELIELYNGLRTPWVEESKEEFYELYTIKPKYSKLVTDMRELCRERNNPSKVESIINRWVKTFNNPNP